MSSGTDKDAFMESKNILVAINRSMKLFTEASMTLCNLSRK